MRQSVGGGATDASVSGRGCEGCVSPWEGRRRVRPLARGAVWPQKVKRIVDRSTAVPPMKGACQATG